MYERQFFHLCETELVKINEFFEEQILNSIQTFEKLHIELECLRESEERRRKLWKSILSCGCKRSLEKGPVKSGPMIKVRKIKDLKLAFGEFYLSLTFLQKYKLLNYTGYRKILKKRDKLLENAKGAEFFKQRIDTAPFYSSKKIDQLILETEQTVINKLEGGNRSKAMEFLRVPVDELPNSCTVFKTGVFSGAFVVLLVILLLTGIFDWGGSIDWPVVFRLYRGSLLITVYTFLMGLNIYGWRSAGVNHVLIFELNPRNHLTELQLLELATFLGFFWALSIIDFHYLDIWDIPPYVNPLALGLFFLVFLFNPLKIFWHDARFWLLRILGRIVGAPFFEVRFADFWLADQLNSLVPVLLDLQYSTCFYATFHGDFSIAGDGKRCITNEWTWIRVLAISCLPAWFRFAQCLRRYRDSHEAFPHLANALKYATTFMVAIFAALHQHYQENHDETTWDMFYNIWIAVRIISTAYGLWWDVRMDWGLFDKDEKTGKLTFLRSEMVYSRISVYYLATLQDLLLRFSWLISLSLVHTGVISSSGESATGILAALEIFRRFVWNYFRLENEHLNNCGKFRAVREIPLTHNRVPYRKSMLRRKSNANDNNTNADLV